MSNDVDFSDVRKEIADVCPFDLFAAPNNNNNNNMGGSEAQPCKFIRFHYSNGNLLIINYGFQQRQRHGSVTVARISAREDSSNNSTTRVKRKIPTPSWTFGGSFSSNEPLDARTGRLL